MRTVLSGVTLFVMTCLLAPVTFLAHALRLPDGIKQWCMQTWGRAICLAAGVEIVVHGAEHVHPARGTVYASNHVSWFDVFVLASVLPRYTFIAKDELRKLPIFGWGAEAAGVIFLSRENRKSAFESYREAAVEMSRGKSVVVFPEGTRGRDYHLRLFKKGPFVLAIAAKVPVVPCIVYGAREVMGKGSLSVHPNVVHVHFLAPVDTTGYDYDQRDDLMHAVWQRMAGCLREVYGVGTDEPEIASA